MSSSYISFAVFWIAWSDASAVMTDQDESALYLQDRLKCGAWTFQASDVGNANLLHRIIKSVHDKRRFLFVS